MLLTAEGADVSRAQEAGADAHLTKPFQEKDLVDQALSLLDRIDDSTVKLDTADMEVLDLGEGDDAQQEDLALDELDLEDDDLLELTDEVEGEGVAPDIEAQEGLAFEEEVEAELKAPEEEPGVSMDIGTDDMEDLSLDDELKDIDLGDLDLDSADEALSLGVDEDQIARPTSDEGEDASADEDTIDLGLEPEELAEEGGPADELEQTGVEFIEDADKKLMETLEEFPSEEEEISVAEEPVSGEDAALLEQTTIDWGEGEEKPTDEEILIEPLAAEEKIVDTGIEEGVEWPGEPPPGLEELPEASETSEIHATDVFEEDTREADEAIALKEAPPVQAEEEIPIQEEAMVQEMVPGLEIEFEEVFTDELPPLAKGLRVELTEEDFGASDTFFEEEVRREISRKLQDMVEGIISELAEPIVERVAREIALERAEKIVMEEIDRLKSQPEGA